MYSLLGEIVCMLTTFLLCMSPTWRAFITLYSSCVLCLHRRREVDDEGADRTGAMLFPYPIF